MHFPDARPDRRRSRVAVAGWALLVLGAAGAVDARGPSTPEERQRVIELAAQLERQPLGREAARARDWLDGFLVEVPDLEIPVCRALLLPMLWNSKLDAVIVAQMLYSGAAFVIEHPDSAGDDFAIYQAGVAGALRAYESLVRQRPRRRLPVIDHLLARRDRGELGRFVHEGMTACRDRR